MKKNLLKALVSRMGSKWLLTGGLLFGVTGALQAQVSGYSFAESNTTYVPITSGVVIGEATNASPSSSPESAPMDDFTYSAELPFPFVFSGGTYDSIRLNTNGWVSFGANLSNVSTPISSTNNYEGVICPFGHDLMGIFATTAIRTSGSAELTSVANTSRCKIGAPIQGTGIPAGTTIVSFTANTITMSNAATSTATTAAFISFAIGEIRMTTTGTAPNRVCVIQYSGMAKYSTTAGTTNNTAIDFQIRLHETTGIINVVYGNVLAPGASNTVQVGLRGNNNTDFNNRTSTTAWTATTAGTTNSATLTWINTNVPANGLTYTWTPANCVGPSGITMSAIVTNAATISWSAASPAPATGYEYYYSTSSTPPTSSTLPSGSTLPSVLTDGISGLTPASTYYVWVRSVCSSTDKSGWVSGGSFITELLVPSPWSEGFSSTTAPSGFNTAGWSIGSTRGVTGNPGNNIYKNLYSTVISGEFSTLNIGPLSANDILSFDFKSALYSSPYGALAAGSGYFKVLVSTNFGQTYTQIDSVSLLTVNTWQNKSYSLAPTYVGQNIKVKIVGNWIAEDYDLAFDNFFIGSCLPPSMVNTTLVTSTNATVAWSAPTVAPGIGYDYYFSTSNTAPTASTTPEGSVSASSLTANLGPLSPSTTYYYWIRSSCSSTDKSSWTSGGSFTTLCLPFNLPFSEGFNSGSIPTCWFTYNSANNTTANALWKFSGAVDYASGNTRPNGSFAWVDGSDPSNISDVTLASPQIVLSGLVNPIVKFDYFSNNTNTYPNNIFKVEVNNGSGWVNIYTDNTSSPNWRTINAPLPAGYANTTIQLRFLVDKTAAPVGYAFYNDILLDSLSIIETPCTPPTVSLGNDTTICVNSTITLDAANVGASYLWSNAATTQTISVSAAGIYWVDVTNGACTTRDTIVVSISALPIVDLGNDTAFCPGATITLDAANAGATYLWSNAATTQSIDVTSAGIYSVAVTNSNGCVGHDTVEVDAFLAVVVDLGNDTTICSDPGLSLDVTITGGTYIWDDASTNPTRDITAAGTYFVTVTDANGCESTDTIDVELVPLATGTLNVTAGAADGSYNMSISGSNGVASVAWNFGNGQTDSGLNTSYTYEANGSYTITAYLINDCGDTTVLTRTIDVVLSVANLKLSEAQFSLYPNPATSVITIANNSGLQMQSVSVYNVLGQQVYLAQASNSSTHQMNVTGFAAGVYTVRVATPQGVVIRKFEVLK